MINICSPSQISVTNPMSEPVDITPYGRIARFGTPETENIFVLHEGLIGVLGDEGLQEIDYSDLQDSKEIDIARVDAGWLGITDKYWATAMIPTGSLRSKFAYFDNGQPLYQAQFVGEQKSISCRWNTKLSKPLVCRCEGHRNRRWL